MCTTIFFRSPAPWALFPQFSFSHPYVIRNQHVGRCSHKFPSRNLPIQTAIHTSGAVRGTALRFQGETKTREILGIKQVGEQFERAFIFSRTVLKTPIKKENPEKDPRTWKAVIFFFTYTDTNCNSGDTCFLAFTVIRDQCLNTVQQVSKCPSLSGHRGVDAG